MTRKLEHTGASLYLSWLITKSPRDQTITYGCIVVDYCPQKPDPNSVRITVDGNLINYPQELTTCTTDLTTAKILWNSVVGTRGTKHKCIDIKNYYLNSNLDHYEYMKMPLSISPHTSLSNTTCKNMPKEDLSILKSEKTGMSNIQESTQRMPWPPPRILWSPSHTWPWHRPSICLQA